VGVDDQRIRRARADRLDLADPFQRKWYIRQVIEPDVHRPSLLINVRGTGYRLVID